MLEKLTNRVRWTFMGLTILPPLSAIVWFFYYCFYYVINRSVLDVSESDVTYYAVCWLLATSIFGLLWWLFWFLHNVAYERQDRIDRDKRYSSRGY